METNRLMLIALLFFVTIIVTDWMYIFVLLKQEEIITFVLIISPAILSLAIVLSLISGFKIYFKKLSGFVGSYLILLTSVLSVLFAYGYIHSNFDDWVYALLIVILNMVSFLLLYILHSTLKHKHHKKISIKST